MPLSGGTIVDATLIAAPPSTKNREQTRDPEMCQSKKGANHTLILCRVFRRNADADMHVIQH